MLNLESHNKKYRTMKTKILNLAAIMLFLTGSSSSCEKENFTTLPPETQTGANTFGCYVNGELFVAQGGYGYFGEPYLYAEYGTKVNILEIIAHGKKGSIRFQILNPQEMIISNSFIITCNINNQTYEGYNWFLVRDTITNENTIVVGNQDVGEIYITRLDTVNKIVSGNFHCKMGKYENDNGLKDINNYILDSVANISQGRFDILMQVNNNW
jgi:hypothetical protein